MANENAVEVTAEVIQEENALAVRFQPASITADFAGMRSKLESMIEPYKGLTAEIAASMDVKEAKACRADLNRISRQLDDDRKAIKKVYEAPLKEFEARIKELQALIKEPCALIDAAIKEREEAERQGRRESLEQVFADFVPEGIGELIGFERVLDPKWLNKSFGQKKAEEELTGRVAAILADWESFKKLKPKLMYPGECEREFWRTLDLRSVNDKDAQLAEEQARIDAMNAEVEETQAYRQQEAPQAAQERQAAETPAPKFSAVCVYALAVECTPGQFEAMIEFFKLSGIHGQPVKTPCASYMQAYQAIKGVFANG